MSVLAAVAVLYFVFVGAVFMGFSGYILRINLEREISNQGSSLDELLFIISQEAVFIRELETIGKEITDKAKEVSDADAVARKLDAEYWQKEAAIAAGFMPVSLGISRNSSLLDPDYVRQFQQILLSSDEIFVEDTFELTNPTKKLTLLVAVPVFNSGADPKKVDEMIEFFRENITKISVLTKELEAISTLKFAEDENIKAKKQHLEELKSKRDAAALRLENHRNSDKYANKARVVSFEPLLWGAFYTLIQVPTIILTLIVTIAAGGLGSVVSFTRGLLVEAGREGTRLLFVSVGEGVAAAVAIFFLAGAGMLMFSTGGGGGGAEISPYMVAFLAFVSGFMAEDAFKSIQRAGQRLFSGDGEESVPAGPEAG